MRERVEAYVKEHPSMCIQTVARGVGADWSTVEYHLRILVRKGLVEESRAGGQRLFRTPGDNGPGPDPLLSDVRARILLAVERAAPISQTEVANLFGLARSGVARHLRLLEDAGLVRRVRAGREVLFVPLRAAVKWDHRTRHGADVSIDARPRIERKRLEMVP